MHGGQGSQNGFDNSGKRGEIHFQDGENSDRAVKGEKTCVLIKISGTQIGSPESSCLKCQMIFSSRRFFQKTNK